MRLGLLLVVSLAAGCSGAGPISIASSPRTKLRLVRCAAALPAPVASDDRALYSGGRERGWGSRGGIGRGRSAVFSRVEKRTGSVSLGMPSTQGSIDAMMIRRIVQARIPELRGCYERELATNRSMTRATVAWRFTIMQNGRVFNAYPTSHAMSSAMNACISAVFKGMRFPARRTGGTITITYPLVFEAAAEPEADEPADEAEPPSPWTPFALDPSPPLTTPRGVSRATESAMRARLGAIEACFDAKAPTGSLRAMLELDREGDLASVRVGGLGHRAIETCLEKAVGGMHVITPTSEDLEVACDLSRGDAQPWRVSPAAGYGLISASAKQLRHRDQVIARGAYEPKPLPDPEMFLIVAEPETPGSMLDLALAWADEGDGAVIALTDGARAPLFLGMGRIAAADGSDASDSYALRPTLQLGPKTLTACVGRATQTAKLAEPAAVGDLVQRVAAKCKLVSCGQSLVIAIDADAVAADLVEVTGAARRSGFERVLLGGQDGCETDDPELESQDG